MGWWGLLGLAGQALLIVFLTLFILSSGDLYRRKVVRLAGGRLADRKVTVEILDEIGEQISSFLMQQVLTGLIVGVSTWLAFWWLGVQYAALWGRGRRRHELDSRTSAPRLWPSRRLSSRSFSSSPSGRRAWSRWPRW